MVSVGWYNNASPSLDNDEQEEALTPFAKQVVVELTNWRVQEQL